MPAGASPCDGAPMFWSLDEIPVALSRAEVHRRVVAAALPMPA
jgi:hypothetical protein